MIPAAIILSGVIVVALRVWWIMAHRETYTQTPAQPPERSFHEAHDAGWKDIQARYFGHEVDNSEDAK